MSRTKELLQAKGIGSAARAQPSVEVPDEFKGGVGLADRILREKDAALRGSASGSGGGSGGGSGSRGGSRGASGSARERDSGRADRERERGGRDRRRDSASPRRRR